MRALLPVLIFFAGLCATSCSTKRSGMSQVAADITVRNDSTNHLDWTKIEWADRTISVGVMSPGNFKMYLDFDLPSGVKTNVAVITFINEDAPGLSWDSGSKDEVRAHRETSWTQLPVDVSRLLQLPDGHYEITFRILNLTNADLVIQKNESK